MADADLIVREPTPYARYVERLRAGVMAYQACGECSAAIFYPRVACPECGSVDLRWEESTGHGTVHSATFVTGRGERPGHHVLLVDLDEGVRVIGAWSDDDTPVKIGQRVHGVVQADEHHEARMLFGWSER